MLLIGAMNSYAIGSVKQLLLIAIGELCFHMIFKCVKSVIFLIAALLQMRQKHLLYIKP